MASGPRVFVVTGPSGVGKGTLIARLLDAVPDLEESVSVTTRSPRSGERDGVDYRFVDGAEFKRRATAGEFLEYAEYAGNLYGTLRSDILEREGRGRSVVLEIEVEGARQIAATLPAEVRIFVAPPSAAALRSRLRNRGTDSEEVIERRLRVATRELEAADEFDYVIVNDEIERAAGELISIVGREIRRPAGSPSPEAQRSGNIVDP